MKNIGFITLLDSTKTQAQLADILQNEANSWFIVSSKNDIKILKSHGVDNNHILDLSITRKDFRKNKLPLDNVDQILKSFEDSRLPYISILFASRMINCEPQDNFESYIAYVLVSVEKFLINNKIEWVFAEPSDLIQLLTQLVCWKNKLNFSQITLVRHPNNRLVLMADCTESYCHALASKKYESKAQEWLHNFREVLSRPSYFKKANKTRSILSLAHSFIKRGVLIIKEMVNKDDLHSLRTDFLIKQYIRNILRRHLVTKKASHVVPAGQKYVAYFLHVQPERSVDVIAPYFVDQLELIKLLRKCLPWDVKLLVKDHPASDGAQTLRFYRELRKIKNVELVSESVDGRAIILNSMAIATISGTASYEAALLKRPAIIFSNVFFSGIPGIHVYNNIEFLKHFIKKISDDAEVEGMFDDELLIQYLSCLYGNSVETSWDGFYGYLSDSNINSMAKLILGVWANSHEKNIIS